MDSLLNSFEKSYNQLSQMNSNLVIDLVGRSLIGIIASDDTAMYRRQLFFCSSFFSINSVWGGLVPAANLTALKPCFGRTFWNNFSEIRFAVQDDYQTKPPI